MSYNVISIKSFDKQAKRLSKKFPSFKKELLNLIVSLETNPIQGTSVGQGCYKIRLAINSKGKGKSGGARIITHIHIKAEAVFLISVYDKSELGNINPFELTALLKEISY